MMCPDCKSMNTMIEEDLGHTVYWLCNDCGYDFMENDYLEYEDEDDE